MSSEDSTHQFTVNEMPLGERPRERLLSHGAQALSNAELLAIILRTGSTGENVIHLAERILNTWGGLVGLSKVSPGELEQLTGMGPGKITQVLALFELAKRLMTSRSDEHSVIKSAEQAAHLVSDMRFLLQENVRTILLDSSRRVISIPTIYIGTLNTTVLRVSEIFREAITRNSPCMILVHNHPSGEANPSPEDIDLTRTLISAGNLLDIQVLDHIIVGKNGWVSLKEIGIVFK
ncbi:MAG: DNA repair protein RadC [Anaerolineae bacterium]